MNVARVGMLNNVSRASFGHDQSQKADKRQLQVMKILFLAKKRKHLLLYQ